MIIKKVLTCYIKGNKEVVYFGLPDNEIEKKQIFKFRYDKYINKGYIEKNDNSIDFDEYDDGRSVYFFAKWNDKIVATIRLIKDNDLLPIQKAFKFDVPKNIKEIKIDQLFELGRFIIVPLDKQNKKFLPRHISMLIFFDVLISFCKENNLRGGYAFVKRSLLKKLLKIKAPIFEIKPFTQVYKDGVLYKYFNQDNDKVIPISFLVSDFYLYISKVFNNKFIFEIDGDNISIKNNLITKILLLFGII